MQILERARTYLARHYNRIALILLLALGLRLAYSMAQDHAGAYTHGGSDTAWYLENGYTLVTGHDPTGTHDVSRLPAAPGYLLYIGFWQAVLPPTAAIIAIRLGQVLMGTALCFFAYDLARLLAGEKAGLIAAAVLAISPALILETASILTETLYMFLLTGALWVYVRYVTPDSRSWRVLALAGVLLGLATLTRAVLLLFPLGLAGHLLLLSGRQHWRKGLTQAGILLLVYALTVSTWTVYNLARWNHFVIAAEGFSSFLFIGATGWEGPQAVDENLGELLAEEGSESGNYSDGQVLEATAQVVGSDPAGYLLRRGRELAGAYLQPHNTTAFPGESLKTSISRWLTEDRSPGGLLDILKEGTFWPKLSLYVFHFGGLLGGLIGLWACRREQRTALPLAGFILYTTLIHLLMLALPRYIFPTYPILWIFAAAWLAGVWQRRSVKDGV